MRRRNEPVAPSIGERVDSIVSSHWTTTGPPTGTSLRAYEIAAEEFAPVLADLQRLDADRGLEREARLRHLDDLPGRHAGPRPRRGRPSSPPVPFQEYFSPFTFQPASAAGVFTVYSAGPAPFSGEKPVPARSR